MQPCSRRIVVRTILLLSAPIWSASAAAENILVAYASLGTAYMDRVVAMEKGYLREEGLSVEIVRAGGGVATPALLSGQLHFSTSAGAALSAAIRGGPLKIVYTHLSKPTYKLVSNKPEIKTVKDLIGKKVAISTFGDTGHLATLLALKKFGIPPSSILFIMVGTNEARAAAYKAGFVDATPLAHRDFVMLGQSGGHVLVDMAKEIQLVWNGVAVSNKLLAENPLLVERFLRAVVKGREYARRYKEQTVTIVAKFDPSPREVIAMDYDAGLASMTEEGWVSHEVLKEEVATRAELIKLSQPPAASKLYDYSIVKKVYSELKASGWSPSL
jgi:NitT/TauT family transport system substrate-binding protein